MDRWINTIEFPESGGGSRHLAAVFIQSVSATPSGETEINDACENVGTTGIRTDKQKGDFVISDSGLGRLFPNCDHATKTREFNDGQHTSSKQKQNKIFDSILLEDVHKTV